MTVYLDASAIVKLVSHEEESSALLTFLLADEEPWATSALARTEVVRAVRAGGEPSIAAARRVLGRASEIAVTRMILDQAAELVPSSRLRSLDAIHLASALKLGGRLSTVVTYDRRMATAAEELGLETAAPE